MGIITKQSQTRKGPGKSSRHKKTERQKAEDLAWKWCSAYIRQRDGNRCVVCGRSAAEGHIMQAGHVFTRGAKAIKYNPINLHCQCSGCNYKHSIDPWPYYDWFIKKYGQEEFDKLRQMKNTTCKRSITDLLWIGENFKLQYERLIGH